MLMFDLHETSKNGISKFSAIWKAVNIHFYWIGYFKTIKCCGIQLDTYHICLYTTYF